MSTDLDRVRSYYSTFSEWERLETSSGALEFRRACALLDTHLTPGARILDLGGGPGRYSIELARRGHRVTLADLSPTLLATARQKLVEEGVAGSVDSIDVADAQNLDRYADSSFEAVLAFGPFYHLLAEEERKQATREIWRVVRPNGLVFAAFIPRLSGVVGLLERAACAPKQVPPGTLTTAARTGMFRNGATAGFQEGYYSTPSEFRELFKEVGFVTLEIVSLRSVANLLEATLARIEEPIRSEADRLLDDLARDPAVVATCGHAVLVASKGSA